MNTQKDNFTMHLAQKRIFFLTILIFSLIIPQTALARKYVDDYDIKALLSEYPTRQEAFAIIRKIENSLKEDPTDYTKYFDLAFIYDYLGLHEKALEATKSEIKYSPEDRQDWDVVYGNLARQYIKLARSDDAKPVIDKALGFDPNNIFNRQHLVSYYILKAMYKEAASELKVLNNLDPDEKWDSYYNSYLFAMDNIESTKDIVRLFQECVTANPNNHSTHRVLAMAMRVPLTDLDKNFSVIMSELNKSLELKPKFVPTYITIGNSYMLCAVITQNKAYFKHSLKWFKKAYKFEPKNVKLAYANGVLFVRMERYDEAIKKLEYAFASSPQEPIIYYLAQAYNNKAYTYYKRGRNLKKGLEFIDKALNLKSNNGVFLSTKAEILYKLKRYDEAYKYIKMAIALEPDHPEIKQDLENIEKALKDTVRIIFEK